MARQKRYLLTFDAEHPSERRVLNMINSVPSGQRVGVLRALILFGHKEIEKVKWQQEPEAKWQTPDGAKKIEMRLNPGNPDERALMDALSVYGDEYGAKSRFFKERLLRGYSLMLDKIDTCMSSNDSIAALDQYAHTIEPKYYRALRVLVTTWQNGNMLPLPSPVMRRTPAPAVMSTQNKPIGLTTALEQNDTTAVDQHQKFVPAEGSHGPITSTRQTYDWSSLSEVAGVKRKE